MATAPKSRLGRGLGGLIAAAKPAPPPRAPDSPAIPPPVTPADAAPDLSHYQEIAVHLIEPSPYQARREISPEQLAELAESIRSEGLLQPIVVRRVGGKFQLIAGERRWRAFQQLNLKTIPARLAEASDASSAALGLIENLQREGLNAIEEAHGYASLIRDFDLTQETAAERVGRNRASVANALRLLSLDAEIQGFIAKDILSTGHAKVLLGIEDPAQRGLLARRAIAEGLSVRATEKLVQGAKASRGGKPAAARRRGVSSQDAVTIDGIQKKLTSHLGTRVAVLHSAKKGRIVIEYHGNEDLQRVLRMLGVEGGTACPQAVGWRYVAPLSEPTAGDQPFHLGQ